MASPLPTYMRYVLEQKSVLLKLQTFRRLLLTFCTAVQSVLLYEYRTGAAVQSLLLVPVRLMHVHRGTVIFMIKSARQPSVHNTDATCCIVYHTTAVGIAFAGVERNTKAENEHILQLDTDDKMHALHIRFTSTHILPYQRK